MGIPAYVYGFVTKGYHTETAATHITETIDAVDGQRLALINMDYLCGATAHVAYLMYAKDYAVAGSSRNTCDGGALSGQKNILCAIAPKDPAGNAAAASDVIAFQLVNGTWEWDTVASLATKTITCTNNITGVDAGAGAAAIADGGKVLILGIAADLARFAFGFTASVRTNIGGGELVIVHPYVGEPFYFDDANATNDGFLNFLVFANINK